MEKKQLKKEQQATTHETSSEDKTKEYFKGLTNLPAISKPNEQLIPFVDSLLQKKTKLELIRTYSNLSIEKISESGCRNLHGLKREYGLEKVEVFVEVILNDLNSSFDGDLEKNQISEIIVEITSGFNANISLEGIYLACRELKYNNTHGKITVNKVLKQLTKHLNDYVAYNETKNYNRYLSQKENPNENRSSAKDMEVHQIANAMYSAGLMKPKKPRK